MNSRQSVSLFKYHLLFIGTYLGIALVIGLLAKIAHALQFLGVLMPYVAARVALGSFIGDVGRAPDRDERGSLLLGHVGLVALITFLGGMVIKTAYDHSALNRIFNQTFPFGFVLLLTLVAAVFAAAFIWWVYYVTGDKIAPAPIATSATTATATAARPRIKVLLVGSGGREHALAWKLAQSRRVLEVLVAPGNAGTAVEGKCRNVDVAAHDIEGLLALAQRENVGLTVVGPEGPLVAGIVNRFRGAGQRIFGPSQAAAQLEGSKAFAKDFLARHKIPTAGYAVFTELEPALAHLRAGAIPVVVKADGLAAGKGVVVATTLAEAEAAATDMLSGNAFGASGARVVVEEFLEGEEASFICVVDGNNAMPMATSQDHKRVGDNDTGPNTGGMGAYSPAPVVTPDVHARIMREVVMPTVRGMAADGMPFSGFLYAGLMIDKAGAAKVIEFNVRFGDPETQPVMMRMKSDLLDLLEAAVDGRANQVYVEWNPRPALGVVMAAENYPGTPRTGDAIDGLFDPVPVGSKVFHAGTRSDNGRVVTSGGRVLCACALGDTIAEAQRNAYALTAHIHWPGEFHRKDIGWRAIGRG